MFPASKLIRSADLYGSSHERHSSFRSESPSLLSLGAPAAPQTGLSVLLNRGVSPSALSTPATVFGTMSAASASLDQQRKDLAEREHQASALAAAGMVAESVRLAQPPPGTTNLGLHPPPQLVTASLAPIQSTEVDNINWNIMDLGSPRLDDLDLDFASLFDPIHEIERMRMDGSGWPSTAGAGQPGTSGASSTPMSHPDTSTS
jgi:hypothetical protein